MSLLTTEPAAIVENSPITTGEIIKDPDPTVTLLEIDDMHFFSPLKLQKITPAPIITFSLIFASAINVR